MDHSTLEMKSNKKKHDGSTAFDLIASGEKQVVGYGRMYGKYQDPSHNSDLSIRKLSISYMNSLRNAD